MEARVARVGPVDRAVDITTPTGERRLDDVAHAHVVPHRRAPRWISDGGLGDGSPAGLVDIDPQTLRCREHENVRAIGDAAGIETRSSGGALREQVKVLAHDIAAVGAGKKLKTYDGLAVVPVTTSRRRLMLVEADREGPKPRHVPLVDPFTPRRATWLFDRYVLPQLSFRRILRGKV